MRRGFETHVLTLRDNETNESYSFLVQELGSAAKVQKWRI